MLSQVDGRVWRGPQPDEATWSELQDLGVTTCVKLNYDQEASDDAAAKYGITVVKFGMPPSGVLDALDTPSEGDVLGALTAICDASTSVMVHCTHGHDRTGLMVGLYRVRQGWTRDAAYAEMLEMGFHRVLHGLDKVWERMA